MELWLVRDVPAWLVGLVLVVGLPSIVLALDIVIHRRLTHGRLGRHNEVTGVIVSVVGVAYAIVIGLCVVSLWEGFSDAEETVREEAANLTALAPASAVFGPAVQASVTAEIVRYQRDIITDWQIYSGVGADRHRVADLGRLTAIVGALRSTTDAQKAFVREAITVIGHGEQLRQRAKAEAQDRQMSPVMWIGVLTTTVGLLGLCLFFGLDDSVLRRVLLVLSSAVIATNLFLIIEMNYPFYGSFSVTPAAYEAVVEDLRPGS